MKHPLTSAAIGLSTGCLGALLTLQSYAPEVREVQPHYNPVLTSFASNIASATEAPSFVEAAERTVDAVVHVKTVQRQGGPANPWFELFGYGTPERIAQGS